MLVHRSDLAQTPALVDFAQATTSSPSAYGDLTDILKTIALFFAAVAPILAVLWQARKERMRQTEPATVGGAGLVAIGGVLANREDTKLYVEQFQGLVEAVDRLTDAQNSVARVKQQGNEQMKDFYDEARKMRLAFEEISSKMGRPRPQ